MMASMEGDSSLVRLPATLKDFLNFAKNTDIQALYNGGTPSDIKFATIAKYCGYSVTNGRPLDKVMIVMAGQSGTGKSSTINSLFDSPDLCDTSSVSSSTTEVTEYKKTLFPDVGKDTTLKLQADLSFIDVPGTLDVDSTKETENFKKIKSFRNTNSSLKSRSSWSQKISGLSCRKTVYPNLVLLIIKADARIDGPDSFFMKTLKVLNEFNLVDKKYPNLMVVMTHAWEKSKKWYAGDGKKMQEVIQTAVMNMFSIKDVRLIFVENKADEYDAEKGEGSDFYLLPNGELSHLNLMNAMVDVFKANSDSLARLLCGWYFMSSCPEKKTSVEVKCLSNIENESYDDEYFHDEQKLAEIGIIVNNSAGKNVSMIQKPVYNLQSLGIGYCPVTESIKHTNAFTFDQRKCSEIQIQGTLYKVPKGVDAFNNTTSTITFVSFNDKESYELNKKTEYGLSVDIPLIVRVASKGKWDTLASASNTEAVVSLLYEKKIATLKIDNPLSLGRLDALNQELANLPCNYSVDNCSTFNDFFEKWGTHIISEQYIGGSIRLDLTIKKSKFNREKNRELENEVQSVFKMAIDGGLTNIQTTDALKTIGVQYQKVDITGGDPPQIMSLQELNNDKFCKWLSSIDQKPVELKNNFKLFPYYLFLTESKRRSALKDATVEYMSGTLLAKIHKKRDDLAKQIIDDVKAEEGTKCFPSFTNVRLRNGYDKEIKDLDANDKVVSMRYAGNHISHSLENSEFLTFLHRNDDLVAEFLVMTFCNGKSLTVSDQHLLFCCDGKDVLPKQVAEFKIGVDNMIYVDMNGVSTYTKLVNVHKETHKGIYAPLTTSGTFLANGFVVSCYAHVNSFSMAHNAFLPLVLWHKAKSYLHMNKSKVPISSGNRNGKSRDGIHNYAKMLVKIQEIFK